MFVDQNKAISGMLAAHIRGIVASVLPSIASPSTESAGAAGVPAELAGTKMFRDNTVLGMAVRRIFDLHCMENGDTAISPEFVNRVIENDPIVRHDVNRIAMKLATLSKSAYTVLRDTVAPAVESIIQDANTRTDRLLSGDSKITQATVESYTWGCLADPMFVNVMMGACYDLAGVFVPDVPVREFYHTACASKVRDHRTVTLEGQERDAAVAAIERLGLPTEMQTRTVDLLTRSRSLQNTVNKFAESYNANGISAIAVLEDLKTVVETLDAVDSALRVKSIELGGVVDANLESVRNAVYLMHGALYTKKETTYKGMIHLGTKSLPGGNVIVYANDDVVPAYEEAGGSMQELATLGRFLDMRNSESTKLLATSIESVRNAAPTMEARVAAFDKEELDRYRSSELTTYRTSLSAALNVWAQNNSDVLHDAIDPADLSRAIRSAVTSATRDADRITSTESVTNVVMFSIPGNVADTLRRALEASYKDRAAVESFTAELRREAQAEAVGNLVSHVLCDYMK